MTNATTEARPAKLPGPNQPCWCGSGEKYKKCHRDKDAAALPAAEPARRPVKPGLVSAFRSVPSEILRPSYAETGKPPEGRLSPFLSPQQIVRMRRAGQAAAQVLAHTGSFVAPGVTTDKLDEIAHAEYIRLGGYPSTLNYHNFPKSLCTSVNEVVCHGIPDDRPLEEGDIVNLDITIFLDGVHGDTSATFLVGKVDEASRQLVRVTRESLLLGIEAVKPGLPINVIGKAIEAHVSKYGYGIVRRYLGHGIGEQFHSDLHVPHHFDPKATTIMQPGMVFTIEPMITMGTWQVDHWKDKWTVVTVDGKRSAQFEHTVLVTETGVEVLTDNPKVFGMEI